MDYTQIFQNSYHGPLKELSRGRFFGGHGFMGSLKYLSENAPIRSDLQKYEGDEGQVRIGPMEPEGGMRGKALRVSGDETGIDPGVTKEGIKREN